MWTRNIVWIVGVRTRWSFRGTRPFISIGIDSSYAGLVGIIWLPPWTGCCFQVHCFKGCSSRGDCGNGKIKWGNIMYMTSILTFSRSSQVPLSVVNRATYGIIRHSILSGFNLSSWLSISLPVLWTNFAFSLSIKVAHFVASWLLGFESVSINEVSPF